MSAGCQRVRQARLGVDDALSLPLLSALAGVLLEIKAATGLDVHPSAPLFATLSRLVHAAYRAGRTRGD